MEPRHRDDQSAQPEKLPAGGRSDLPIDARGVPDIDWDKAFAELASPARKDLSELVDQRTTLLRRIGINDLRSSDSEFSDTPLANAYIEFERRVRALDQIIFNSQHPDRQHPLSNKYITISRSGGWVDPSNPSGDFLIRVDLSRCSQGNSAPARTLLPPWQFFYPGSFEFMGGSKDAKSSGGTFDRKKIQVDTDLDFSRPENKSETFKNGVTLIIQAGDQATDHLGNSTSASGQLRFSITPIFTLASFNEALDHLETDFVSGSGKTGRIYLSSDGDAQRWGIGIRDRAFAYGDSFLTGFVLVKMREFEKEQGFHELKLSLDPNDFKRNGDTVTFSNVLAFKNFGEKPQTYSIQLSYEETSGEAVVKIAPRK